MAVVLAPPTRPQTSSRLSASAAGVLRGWHLLSLDAPTVAVVWTASIASADHVRLPASELCALFLAVWLLYVADRLLDSRQTAAHVAADASQQPRHRFHRKHRKAFLIAAACGATLLLPLTLRLGRADLHADLLLASLLLLWFAFIHVLGGTSAKPKELATGLFFAAATLIPSATRHPVVSLLPAAVLFAALCTLNGFFITAWESRSPTRTLARVTVGLTAIAVLLAATLARQAPTLAAISLAAISLYVLGSTRTRLNPTTLRAAADLALLTPLVVWPVWLLLR